VFARSEGSGSLWSHGTSFFITYSKSLTTRLQGVATYCDCFCGSREYVQPRMFRELLKLLILQFCLVAEGRCCWQDVSHASSQRTDRVGTQPCWNFQYVKSRVLQRLTWGNCCFQCGSHSPVLRVCHCGVGCSLVPGPHFFPSCTVHRHPASGGV
jgi:hypothetical protein